MGQGLGQQPNNKIDPKATHGVKVGATDRELDTSCCVGTKEASLEKMLSPNYHYTTKNGYLPSKAETQRIKSTRAGMLDAFCPDPESGKEAKVQLTKPELAAFDPKRFVGFKSDGAIFLKGFGGKEYPITHANAPINAETVALARRLGFDVNAKTPYKNLVFMAYNNSVTGGTAGAKLLAIASAINKPLEFAFATAQLDAGTKKFSGQMPKLVNGKVVFTQIEVSKKPTTCQCPLRLGYGENTGGANWCKQGVVDNFIVPTPPKIIITSQTPADIGYSYTFGSEPSKLVPAQYIPGVNKDMCFKESGKVVCELRPDKPHRGSYNLWPVLIFGGAGADNVVAQCVQCIAPGLNRVSRPN